MDVNSIILPLFLVSLVLPLTSSQPSSDDSTYTYFQQCLKTHIKPAPTPASVSSILVAKSNPNYTAVLKSTIHNSLFLTPTTHKPALIITPTTPAEVSASVVCTKAAPGKLNIRIRSGGHDYAGLSCTSTLPGDFVILDLLNFRQIDVNAAAKTAKVGVGATMGELYYAIWKSSKTLAYPGGLGQTIGVGGHVSGAGYGHLVRKYGLTSDHVHDAEIVLADGRILDRKGMGEDLFWAISGGGGASFGVILSFSIDLVDVPEKVTDFTASKLGPDGITDLVSKWQHVMQDADNNLFMRILLQPYTDKDVKQPTTKLTFIGLYLGNTPALVSLMKRILPELNITDADCKKMSWAETILYWENRVGLPVHVLDQRNSTAPIFQYRKSDYVLTPIPKEGLDKLWAKLGSLAEPGMVFNSYGGAMRGIPIDKTPFPHRDALLLVQYSGNWQKAEESDKNIAATRELYSLMEPYVSKNPRRAFWNYRDLDIGVNVKGTYEEGKVYGEKYFMGNFDRLVKVKTVVDPDNFFRHEQTIPVRRKRDEL